MRSKFTDKKPYCNRQLINLASYLPLKYR